MTVSDNDFMGHRRLGHGRGSLMSRAALRGGTQAKMGARFVAASG